jgi:hypothetical protein
MVLGLFGSQGPARAGDSPDFLRFTKVENKPPAASAVARENVLALDTAMMGIYEDNLGQFKRNLLNRVPIIVALFSGGGGRLILYRPGHEPLTAAPVPDVYEIMKSVSHSSMAIYELVGPYVDNSSDPSWRGPMLAFRVRCQTALEGVDALELPQDQRDLLRSILRRNVAFMDGCLKNGIVSLQELEAFARDFKPAFGKTIAAAGTAQVAHWFEVLAGWKTMLGDDWDSTYAVTNSLYVTRQNNILFTVLAQFMGEKAIGSRLFLFETTSFTTTPETMLDILGRVVADRSLGQVFFKDYYLMDAELLGGGARKSIAAEAIKRGMTPRLPPMAPFQSTEWPWHTDAKKGKGPATLEEVK